MGEDMKASSLSFRAAVLFVIAGMGWGIVMAGTDDHSAMPAHAHLNLLGWVSLFLFGIFYHLHPVLDRSRTALLHCWIWIVATVIATIGIGLVTAGNPSIGEPLAGIGSVILLADMMLFAVIVFRRSSAENKVSVGSAIPAE